MTLLRGSIRFSPSPRATEVSFLLSNSELATSTRLDFDRFWNVWLSAPRLQTLRLEFAISTDEGPVSYDGINQFLAHFAYHVLPNEDCSNLTLEFYLNNCTELDDRLVMKEVLEAPVELYNSRKHCFVEFVTDDVFIRKVARLDQ